MLETLVGRAFRRRERLSALDAPVSTAFPRPRSVETVADDAPGTDFSVQRTLGVETAELLHFAGPCRRKNCVFRNRAQTLPRTWVRRRSPTLDCGSTQSPSSRARLRPRPKAALCSRGASRCGSSIPTSPSSTKSTRSTAWTCASVPDLASTSAFRADMLTTNCSVLAGNPPVIGQMRLSRGGGPRTGVTLTRGGLILTIIRSGALTAQPRLA